MRICMENNIFKPTNIAIGANHPATIAKWIRWPMAVLVGLRQTEEADGLSLQMVGEVLRDSVVNHLEESKFLAGPHELRTTDFRWL